MERLKLLCVLIGPLRLTAGLPQPTLLVEAEADRLSAYRQQFAHWLSTGDLESRQAVLAATANSDVNWYAYNDPRLNGVVPLERWQPYYPNLQLSGQTILPADTLANILSTWPAAAEHDRELDLTISQGDPLQVLAGAGSWLQRMRRIELQGPRAAELWRESLDPWLQEQGFRPDPHDPLIWTLDPLASRLSQQQAELEALRLHQQQELDSQAAREQQLLSALSHVFPYTTYRQQRPDIASFSDEDLVDHFVVHGIHESINLQFSALESNLQSQLQQLRAEREAETARVELLQEKSRHTAQQLDLLKDLFARLMVNP
jgi:cell division protein FtsB